MTQEEFTKLVEALKAQGLSDEDILGTLLEMLKEGKVSPEDLEKLAGSMGYEVTEEFKKLTAGGEEPEGEITEEEVEEAQEIPESREEEPEEESEEPEESEEETEETEEESEEEPSEEEEKEEARKLYGLGE